MKLIKLSDTHYIGVDDSKRGYHGYNYNFALSRIDNLPLNYKEYSSEWNWCYKITHSTPIGGLSAMLVAGVKELSLSEVEEVIYGYSVEKMALKKYGDDNYPRIIENRKGFKDGFRADQELTKDKLFTIDDIEKAVELARKKDEYKFDGKPVDYIYTEIEIVQLLLPKTEWEVEFDEQGKLKLI